jgi:hypothetical protein
VPPPAIAEASAVCEALATRLIDANVTRDQMRICADFKLLGGDKVVLVWAALAPADAVFPSHAFPASMPAAKLPSEATEAPRRTSTKDSNPGRSRLLLPLWATSLRVSRQPSLTKRS